MLGGSCSPCCVPTTCNGSLLASIFNELVTKACAVTFTKTDPPASGAWSELRGAKLVQQGTFSWTNAYTPSFYGVSGQEAFTAPPNSETLALVPAQTFFDGIRFNVVWANSNVTLVAAGPSNNPPGFAGFAVPYSAVNPCRLAFSLNFHYTRKQIAVDSLANDLSSLVQTQSLAGGVTIKYLQPDIVKVTGGDLAPPSFQTTDPFFVVGDGTRRISSTSQYWEQSPTALTGYSGVESSVATLSNAGLITSLTINMNAKTNYIKNAASEPISVENVYALQRNFHYRYSIAGLFAPPPTLSAGSPDAYATGISWSTSTYTYPSASGLSTGYYVIGSGSSPAKFYETQSGTLSNVTAVIS